jgi:hypothetical protein
MQLPAFLRKLTFEQIMRFLGTEGNFRGKACCVRCGTPLAVYRTNAEPWGVCGNCGLTGNPVQHLAVVLHRSVAETVRIAAEQVHVAFRENASAIPKYSAALVQASEFLRLFRTLPTIDRFQGNPFLTESLELHRMTASPERNEWVRTAKKREIFAICKTLDIPCRLTSEGLDEMILILPLKDAPAHPTGFLTAAGNGVWPADFHVTLFHDEDDCGFLLPDEWDKEILLVEGAPLWFALQADSLKTRFRGAALAGWFGKGCLYTQHHSQSWELFAPVKKTFWSPLRRDEGIIEAWRNKSPVSVLRPEYATEESLREWIAAFTQGSLPDRIRQTAVPAKTAVRKRLLSKDGLDTRDEFLEQLKLSPRELRQLSEDLPAVEAELLQTAVQRHVTEADICVGTRQYVEMPDGWYLRNRTSGTLSRVSSLKCRILSVVKVVPTASLHYLCEAELNGQTCRVFLDEREFETQLVKKISRTALTEFLEVPEIHITQNLFKQLTAAFSNYTRVEIRHGCGWSKPTGAVILPSLLAVEGDLKLHKTPFPDDPPAKEITRVFRDLAVSPEIFGHFGEYTRSAAYVLADHLRHLFISSTDKPSRSTVLITDTAESWVPLYRLLGPVFDPETLRKAERFCKLHKWPVFVETKGLSATRLQQLFSQECPYRDRLLLRLGAGDAILRAVFNQTNLIFLHNTRAFASPPESLLRAYAAVWLESLVDLTGMTRPASEDSLLELCLETVGGKLQLSGLTVGSQYVQAGPLLNPGLFADMIRYLRYTEKLEPEHFSEENGRLRIDRQALAKVIGKAIGFYCEDAVIRLLDRTDARLSFRHSRYLEIDLDWYASRAEKVDDWYGRYLTYF